MGRVSVGCGGALPHPGGSTSPCRVSGRSRPGRWRSGRGMCTGNSPTFRASISRVARGGYAPGFADLLHHHIARSRLDNPLGLRNVVAASRMNRRGMGSYPFVLSHRELDQLSATQPGARAAKPGGCISSPGHRSRAMPSLTSRNRASFAAARCSVSRSVREILPHRSQSPPLPSTTG